jgi:hypothetical protein
MLRVSRFQPFLDGRLASTMKPLLILLGFLSALLILAQLVMGLLIRNGQAAPALRTTHFHSGTLMVIVSLAYIGLSLSALISKPSLKRGG